MPTVRRPSRGPWPRCRRTCASDRGWRWREAAWAGR